MIDLLIFVIFVILVVKFWKFVTFVLITSAVVGLSLLTWFLRTCEVCQFPWS